MHICSYLVHVRPGLTELDRVVAALNAIPHCEAVPSTDPEQALIVLITETPDREADEALRKQIEALPEIECLALVFGANDSNLVPAS